MAKPKAFNTYLDNQNKLETLSDQQAGRLYKALCAYAAAGKKPDFNDDPVLQYAFLDFSGQIDRDFEKYKDTCEKRRESGKKGGAPSGNDNAKKQANVFKNNQNKQMVIETTKTSQEEKEEKEEKEIKKSTYTRVVDLFNAICKSLPKVRSINDTRRRRIDRAAKQLGPVTFEALFRMVEKSDFLTGKTKDWVASFDWILEPKNLTKIIEGNYDNKKPRKGSVYSTDGASFDVSEYEGSSMFDD